jgi:sec-independent protein translocase protein TatA
LFGLRGQELLIILLIVLLIFGARKLPDLARSLGASAKDFRKGIEEGSQEEAPEDQQSNVEQSDTAKSDTPREPDS